MGVKLYRQLNLKAHVENFRKKAARRLNLIKDLGYMFQLRIRQAAHTKMPLSGINQKYNGLQHSAKKSMQ